MTCLGFHRYGENQHEINVCFPLSSKSMSLESRELRELFIKVTVFSNVGRIAFFLLACFWKRLEHFDFSLCQISDMT